MFNQQVILAFASPRVFFRLLTGRANADADLPRRAAWLKTKQPDGLSQGGGARAGCLAGSAPPWVRRQRAREHAALRAHLRQRVRQLHALLQLHPRLAHSLCVRHTFTTACRERQVISRIALLRERRGGYGREHLHRAEHHHHGPFHSPRAVCQHQLAVLHLLEAVFLLQ